MKFALLDPRPAARKAQVEFLINNACMGIEVTIPELAALCAHGNVDPQHIGGNVDRAAIEEIFELYFQNPVQSPMGDVTLVTVRADLDSIGSMALIKLDNEIEFGGYSAELVARVTRIADSDKFTQNGEWQPQPQWSEATNGDGELQTLAAYVTDFKVDINTRVQAMAEWLLHGTLPAATVEDVATTQNSECYVDGNVSVVIGDKRAGTNLAYCAKPVIVCLSPNFSFNGGKPHAKFTIAQFKAGYVDMEAVKAELNSRENGWGGSPTIIGSPQGVASELTIDEVVAIVNKHII